MAKIEGKCREVLDKTEWVAVATTGVDGPHLAGTWGGYIRALGIKDDEIILIPTGGYLMTEQNIKKDNRIEILCATQQVQGDNGPGKGCRIRGTGQVQTSGKLAEVARKKFPWARGVLVIKAEEVIEQL
ncbi:MAG: pyridoxamine 5'-phosphate oxidase family protein [Spirochaetota bacterium]